jgi:hypothetical protein
VTYLGEIPEAEATGEVAFVYGEIRRLSGVPMCALVYRHLATLPGVLEACWRMIGPLMASGRLQEAAWRIVAATKLAPLPPFRDAALMAVGVDAAAKRRIADVLDAYNRANPVNLLVVSTLAIRMQDRHSPVVPLGEAHWVPPAPLPPLPPMVAPDRMSPAVRAVIEDVGCHDQPAADRLVPSLYRHLPPWPGYLALTDVLLVPRIEDGSVGRAVREVRGAMQRQAGMLAPAVPFEAVVARSRAVLDAFARFSEMIPEMIVVGRLLRDALPDPASPS